jgi:hypothetical protein
MAGGIVTLLFTDVVGSTELLGRLGEDRAYHGNVCSWPSIAAPLGRWPPRRAGSPPGPASGA